MLAKVGYASNSVGCFSFFFWLRVLDKAQYSAFESTLNSPIVSYRIDFSYCFNLGLYRVAQKSKPQNFSHIFAKY